MANIIFNEQVSEDSCLQMSNGGTSVFIGLLAMALSALARSDREKLFARCIAACDQGVVGSGAVGFDVADLPWSNTEEAFGADKRFVIASIERAIAKTDWHKLDYQPAVDLALENQYTFLGMINCLELQHVVGEFDPDNFVLMGSSEGLCERHGVYLHEEGCVVCNDE